MSVYLTENLRRGKIKKNVSVTSCEFLDLLAAEGDESQWLNGSESQRAWEWAGNNCKNSDKIAAQAETSDSKSSAVSLQPS